MGKKKTLAAAKIDKRALVLHLIAARMSESSPPLWIVIGMLRFALCLLHIPWLVR